MYHNLHWCNVLLCTGVQPTCSNLLELISQLHFIVWSVNTQFGTRCALVKT